VIMQTADTLKSTGQTNWQRLQQWSTEYHLPLQTVGLVALAGVTGMALGVIAAKGILATKGASAVGAALVQNSATAQSAGSILTGAATLPDKAVALFALLTHNALPITAGAVGGGAAGVGVMQGQVRRTKQALDAQVAQTTAAQAETSQVQSALNTAEAQLSQLQTQLTPAPVAPNPLEQIQGIGPVFARRLHEAGIVTLADLAAQTPEQVRAVVANVRGGKMANVQMWIDQAQQLVDNLNRAGQPSTTDPTTAA
jgi:predicted flap endonuclease-1-like 5' DNA nuclease